MENLTDYRNEQDKENEEDEDMSEKGSVDSSNPEGVSDPIDETNEDVKLDNEEESAVTSSKNLRWRKSNELDQMFIDNLSMFYPEPEILNLPKEFHSTPIEFFFLYFTNYVYQRIAEQSNIYLAQQILQGVYKSDKKNSTKERFENEKVTADDIKAYVALNIFFVIERLPEIKQHWIEKDIILSNQFVKSLMSYQKYCY